MEKISSPIKARIIEYLNLKGISKRQCYKDTGIANGTFDKNGGLGESGLEKFISTYKDVDLVWLITGEGEILINENQYQEPKQNLDMVEDYSHSAKMDELASRTMNMYHDLLKNYKNLADTHNEFIDKYNDLERKYRDLLDRSSGMGIKVS